MFTGSGTQHGGQELNHSLNDPYASTSRYDRGRASLLISGAEHNGARSLAAVRLTAHLRSLNLTAAACHQRTNLRVRAFKAATSRRSRANSEHDLLLRKVNLRASEQEQQRSRAPSKGAA